MLGKIVGFIVGREPVATGAVVTAILTLAVAFGADLSEEQLAAVAGAVVVIVGYFARSVVTPVHKVEAAPAPGVPR